MLDSEYGDDVWDLTGASWCRCRLRQQFSPNVLEYSVLLLSCPWTRQLYRTTKEPASAGFRKKTKKYTLYLPNHTASHSWPSWRSDVSVNRIDILQQNTYNTFLRARRWNPWLRRVFKTSWHMACLRRGVTREDSSGSTCPSVAPNCTSNHFNKQQYSSNRTSTSKPVKPSPVYTG
jgi:hypothetical protein